ncbi:MAG: lipoyl(octanoyl) transferase LipB [Candidatus Atribacteria bacterium]|nr:lipoyl(octanoyl) transferase LipB [Candidatus Atribacteria bacterium]MCD6349333.1 lipoyl(octanoyl) transferase LipB [Candidatus Atribacteria bacterium]
MEQIFFLPLPLVSYQKAWELQLYLVEKAYKENLPGFLLLLEHHPVVTLGRSANVANLRLSLEGLREKGIGLFRVERGGDVTYHGPGQIVGYPIFNLRFFGKDVHRFVRLLEEVLIRFLRNYQVEAFRFPPYTGVWVNPEKPEKIAAIGVAVRRWVTFHGFALNVSTDLTPFSYIIPCGIREFGVTSLEKCTTKKYSLKERKAMCREIGKIFGEVFSFSVKELSASSQEAVLDFLEKNDKERLSLVSTLD